MPAPIKPSISKTEFDKVDLRVGTIVRAEAVESARSLVRLTVDLGDEQRVILAGLKQERPDLSELEGIQTLFVVNLEPRQMMGETSSGMLCDVGHADGIEPVLTLVERPVPNGTRVG
jgi:tRNA-binding protein